MVLTVGNSSNTSADGTIPSGLACHLQLSQTCSVAGVCSFVGAQISIFGTYCAAGHDTFHLFPVHCNAAQLNFAVLNHAAHISQRMRGGTKSFHQTRVWSEYLCTH